MALLAAYLFDPERGRERRTRLAERTRALVPGSPFHTGTPGADSSQGWPEEPPPDVDSED